MWQSTHYRCCEGEGAGRVWAGRVWAVCCVLCAVCCVLCAVCCVLCAVCCVLCAVCCVLCAVCCDACDAAMLPQWVGLFRFRSVLPHRRLIAQADRLADWLADRLADRLAAFGARTEPTPDIGPGGPGAERRGLHRQRRTAQSQTVPSHCPAVTAKQPGRGL